MFPWDKQLDLYPVKSTWEWHLEVIKKGKFFPLVFKNNDVNTM